jgi:hypothetical protein
LGTVLPSKISLMKNAFLALLAACVLFSCEKDETIFIPDYNNFCPVHFKYWPEIFPDR